MTDRDFEGRLRAGLRQMVEEGASGALRASIFAIPDVVPASPQRRFAARWQCPRMSRFAPIALAATAVVVTILIGIGLVLRSPNIGPSPVPGPTHSTAPEPTAQARPAMFAFIHPLDAPGRGALWVANVDGTDAHPLVPDEVGDQDAPAWSPDGSRLVFSWDLKTGAIRPVRPGST